MYNISTPHAAVYRHGDGYIVRAGSNTLLVTDDFKQAEAICAFHNSLLEEAIIRDLHEAGERIRRAQSGADHP